MKIRTLVGMLITAVLAACGSKSDSTPGNGKPDLKELAKSAPGLTDQQRERAKQLIKNDQSLLPEKKLYFDNYENAQDRKRDMDLLNSEGIELLNLAKANCQISPERETREGEASVGKTLTTTRNSAISGVNCPIEYSSNEVSRTVITNFNQADKTVSANINGNKSRIEKVKHPSISQKIMAVEYKIDTVTQIQFSNYKADDRGNLVTGTIDATINETAVGAALRGEKYNMSTITEMRQTQSEQIINYLMTVELPDNIKLVLGLFIKNESIEFIVNGEVLTPNQFGEKYGDWIKFPISSPQVQ